MKKIIFIAFVFFFLAINTHASSWKFVWDESTTTIEVKLFDNIRNYTDKPKAKLYRDNQLVSDADIHYITEGDWLYLLSDVDTTKEGIYQVWYKAIDTKYRPGQCPGYKCLINFKVVDVTAPVISYCPIEWPYKIGSEKPDYSSLVKASDDSGSFEVTYNDSAVDYLHPGTYPVNIYVSDKNNTTEATIMLIVEDNEGPVIQFLGENKTITLNKNDKISLISYFKAIDSLDGDVTHTISYLPFSTSVVDDFYLNVSFNDLQGNVSGIEIRIIIIDEDMPIINLYQEVLVLEYEIDFDVYSFLDNVKSATFGDEDIKSEITVDVKNLQNKVGIYYISYSFSRDEKSIVVDCQVSLLSYQKPIIEASNIEMYLGENIVLSDYISVLDPSDMEIEDSLEIDDTQVVYDVAGKYPITIVATNSSGLSTTQTIFLTVRAKGTTTIDYKIWIISGGLLLLVSYGGYRFYKKKKTM